MIDLENSNHEKKTPYVLCSLIIKKKCGKFITYDFTYKKFYNMYDLLWLNNTISKWKKWLH